MPNGSRGPDPHNSYALIEVFKGDGTRSVVSVPKVWRRGDPLSARRLQDTNEAVAKISRGAIDAASQVQFSSPGFEATEAVILEVLPDALKCSLGTRLENDLPNRDEFNPRPAGVALVLKPYVLRTSTWLNRKISGVQYTRRELYSGDLTGQSRNANMTLNEGEPNEEVIFEAHNITPFYRPGDRILIAKNATGGSALDGPRTYFDLNVDGRVWAQLV